MRRNGVALQVGDTESFFTTFLRGTVGVLSLDALELAPQWISGSGDGGGHGGDNHASSISAGGPDKTPEGGANGEGGSLSVGEEPPLLGEDQWQRLQRILEDQVGPFVGACASGSEGSLPRRTAVYCTVRWCVSVVETSSILGAGGTVTVG